MKELQSFLMSEELLIIYAVIAVLIVITVVFIIGKKTYNYRKRKQNTKELNKLVGEVHERLEEDKTNIKVNETIKHETLEPIPEIIEPKKEEKKEIMEEKVNTVETVNINSNNKLKEGILIPSSNIIEVNVPKEEVMQVAPPRISIPNMEVPSVEPLVEQLDEIEMLEDDMSKQEIENGIISMPVEIVEIKAPVPVTVTPKPTQMKIETDELQYEDAQMDQTKAQQEIEKLTKELVNASATVENIELTNFEEEQEKNAIISLDEFLKLGDSLYDKNEITQYEDEGNEPISIEDLEARKQESVMMIEEKVEQPKKIEQIKPVEKQPESVVQAPLKMDDFYSAKPAYNEDSRTTKFKSSPVISPVYGIEKPETAETMALENTANYDKLDEEIRKTNEFLSTLRELQEKLD